MKKEVEAHLGHHSDSVTGRGGGSGRRAAHGGGRDAGGFGQRRRPRSHHRLALLRGDHLGCRSITRRHRDGLLGKDQSGREQSAS